MQLELIQTIDNIVFYPATSRKEDQENLALAQVNIPELSASVTLSSFHDMIFQADISQEPQILDQQREEQGMYRNLKTPQLFLLTGCLMKSHRFARSFNSHPDQANLFSKSGKH